MKTASAGTAFVFAAVTAAVVLGFACGGLSYASSLVSLALGGAAAWAAMRTTVTPPPSRLRVWDGILIAVFTLASARAFLWLIGERGDEVFILSPNNLGDMSLHLNFIRYFAAGVPFWPDSPILTGAPLTYPLGADLFNSLLEIVGVPTYRGLVWAGLLGAALTGLALWRWAGAFGLAALLFNGGLTGFLVFQTGHLEDFQTELVWKNLFLSMFVTQRGLLFALPAGLLLLTAWRDEFFRASRPPIARWQQVLLYGVMPLFSLHTFIFLSLALVAIFAFAATSRRTLLRFLAASVLPATLGVLLVTGKFSASGGLHPAWGWLVAKGWTAFLMDFGITLPLGLVTVGLAFWKKDAEARCFTLTAAGVFALCAVLAFSRWEWDNMKLMMWSWLVLAPFLWGLVLRPLQWPAQAALCFLLFFSGAVSLLGGLDARHGYFLASRSELAAWQAALKDIPATDRIAIMPDYNHPVLLLGRKVACGYDGHLWSHGLDYGAKMALTKDALSGAIPWSEAAPQLDVQWAAIRRTDQPGTVTSGIGTLSDLRPCLTPSPTSPPPQPGPPQSVGLSW